MTSSNVNASAVANETEFSYSKFLFLIIRFLSIINDFF